MPFAIAIIWRKGKDHITNYYFCIINLKGINRKNKHHVQYPDVPAAIRPIPHSPDLSAPEPDGKIEYSSDSEHSDMIIIAGDDAYKLENDDQFVPLRQAGLNEFAQLLGSRLKRKICFHQEQRSTSIETVREN